MSRMPPASGITWYERQRDSFRYKLDAERTPAHCGRAVREFVFYRTKGCDANPWAAVYGGE
jgi:hypothetical protein